MKKSRAVAVEAMIEDLRRRGAVIGPPAGESLAAAARAQEAVRPAVAAELPRESPRPAARSIVRRFKSGTEARFAAGLDARQAAGEILRWRYEAVRLQLAEVGQPAVTYTPDFLAWLPGGRRVFYEVKSRYRRDSDTETRRIFLWARQSYGDACHAFRAYRECDDRPGEFCEIWSEQA